MWLLQPKHKESKRDFLKRCVENPKMNNKYPELRNRFKTCCIEWKKNFNTYNKYKLYEVSDD